MKAMTIDSRIPHSFSNGHSQIDRMVYELYGLTEEEIRVVEGLPEVRFK
jgi:hypothetical protein